MSPEQSPSKGWQGTYREMGVDHDLSDKLEKSADDLREHGFDQMAEALEQTAEKVREVRADA